MNMCLSTRRLGHIQLANAGVLACEAWVACRGSAAVAPAAGWP